MLNKPAYRKAQILVAGENFGCGSSREHAPWALLDYGIRCVISTAFGDIFYNNCFKNGILPIRVSPEDLEKLFDDADRGDPGPGRAGVAEESGVDGSSGSRAHRVTGTRRGRDVVENPVWTRLRNTT